MFISYARDSDDHLEMVREFYVFLRAHGVDARLDPLKGGHREEWSVWIRDEIRAADFVLVIASPDYRRAADGGAAFTEPRGVQWEARQLLDELYRNFEAGLDRILPVVLPGKSSKDVPPFLLIADYYTITDFSLSGSESLLRVLTGQPAEITPPLGAAPTLEPRPSERNGRRRLAKIRKGLAAAWSLTCWAARAFRRAITAINRFIERISNWFFWAVGGGILPLLCTWALNVKEESNLEELLGSGELFIVSAVLVAATYGELLREGKRSKEASKIDGPKPAIKEVGWKAAWPSQGSKFACFASAVGAIAGYGGVSTNGAQVTTYLSISVFAFTLVTGAAVMNGIERDE